MRGRAVAVRLVRVVELPLYAVRSVADTLDSIQGVIRVRGRFRIAAAERGLRLDLAQTVAVVVIGVLVAGKRRLASVRGAIRDGHDAIGAVVGVGITPILNRARGIVGKIFEDRA